MIRFLRIEIENFVVFDRVVIEPSIDPERPLTVIRGENGSGKTTVLRALRWGMYGEKGLPGTEPSRFPIQPLSWLPANDKVCTKVTIEFETDGSTRNDMRGGLPTQYRLCRSVTTIGKPEVGTETDFRRISERAHLMVKEADAQWRQHTHGVDSVIEELLPWNLRDFFVMDADEATDFVGGAENKTVSPRDVEKKTTAAVHSLLGIDVFHEAAKRVEAIGREFGRKATDAIGDAHLDDLQADLEQKRADKTELDERLGTNRESKAELDGRRSNTRLELDNELKDIGAIEEIRKRLSDNEKATDRAKRQRKEAVALLAGNLESPNLLASLITRRSAIAYKQLKPLYDEGLIPQKHLGFVRDLLLRGTCVCGEDLAAGGIHRRHVEDLIADSKAEESRANFLGQIHDAAKSAVDNVGASEWRNTRQANGAMVEELAVEIDNLTQDRRDIDAKLDAVEEEKVQILRDEMAALDEQIVRLTQDIAEDEGSRPSLMSAIDSLEKTILQRHKGDRAAKDHRMSESIADAVTKVLQNAYASIQSQQVEELSTRMQRLFRQMVEDAREDEINNGERDKASVRNISQVGVRPLNEDCEKFQIFALNSRGRTMSPTEINGASRRILALSFVLALCAESRTFAPLVADSLLNMMSGAVRRNTLSVAVSNSSQPILLLMPADLETQEEVAIVHERAGATYTLTSQADVQTTSGGDVLRRTSEGQVSVLCSCGPRQYCTICERRNQAETPGWSPASPGGFR